MRAIAAAVSALVLLGTLGCTTTRVAQRDGCWVRRTESFPKQVKEEVGVCARPPPVWSHDRVARLVQECMAEADYRWQNKALAYWNNDQALPPQQSEHEVMQSCMRDAATDVVAENEALKKRIAEVTAERDAMSKEAAADRQNLRDSQARMTDALGEAAKRPAPNAYATANSSGQATNRSATENAAAAQPSSAPTAGPGGLPQVRELARPELPAPVPVLDLEPPEPKPRAKPKSDKTKACPLPVR